MKAYLAAGASLLMVMAGEVTADCNSPIVTDLNALLAGKTVCVAEDVHQPPFTDKPALSPFWASQEEHRADGSLWDYKRGPSDSLDPTKKLGTWSISGNNITYSYTAFNPNCSITFTVHDNGNTLTEKRYSFCAIMDTCCGGPGDPCPSYPKEYVKAKKIQDDPNCGPAS